MPGAIPSDLSGCQRVRTPAVENPDIHLRRAPRRRKQAAGTEGRAGKLRAGRRLELDLESREKGALSPVPAAVGWGGSTGRAGAKSAPRPEGSTPRNVEAAMGLAGSPQSWRDVQCGNGGANPWRTERDQRAAK